jgi:hypothetical protein
MRGVFLIFAACDPSGAPTIALLQPVDGATVCGAPLVIEVQVDNLDLVAPVDDPATASPGTGHVDVTLNGQDVAMFWAETIEVPGVEAGEYQLKAELSNADHTPVDPYAGAFVYITVTEAACSR